MKSYYILAPFSLKSVLFYHQLKSGKDDNNSKVIGWFDANSLLWGKEYDGCYIEEAYYSSQIGIIICTDRKDIEESIKKSYYDLGYQETDFLSFDELEIGTGMSRFEASVYVKEKRFMELKPEKWRSLDLGDGIARIKKMRMWYNLTEKESDLE